MTKTRRGFAVACLLLLLVATPLAASPQESVSGWFDGLLTFLVETLGIEEPPRDFSTSGISLGFDYFGSEDSSSRAAGDQEVVLGGALAVGSDVAPVGTTDDEYEGNSPATALFPEVEPVG